MDLPSFPHVDLFAAGVNALNGTLIARAPKHNRGYTVVGLLIMAFIGGVGGGISRDLLLNVIPGPLKDVSFLIVCLLMGLAGLAIYELVGAKGEIFRARTLSVVKSFTLPWFAVLGAHKALDQDLGIFAAVLVGVIATTAGGVITDLFSGVTPEVVEPSELIVATAVIASSIYAVGALQMRGSLEFFPLTLTAVGIAFIFRLAATHWRWWGIVPQPPSLQGAPGAASARRG